VDGLRDRPAEVAGFLATAAGRSFATGAAYERALATLPRAGAPRVFVARQEGRIVGALPGRLEARFGGHWFRSQPLGTPAGPCFDPALADQGVGALAGVASALWREVGETARREGWLGGDITLSGPAAAAGAEALRPPADVGSIRHDEVHVIDLSAGAEAWRPSLDKRARSMLRRAINRGVELGHGDGGADLARVYELFVEQARAWGLKQVRSLSFYRALMEPPTDARLWIGRLGGEIVCGVLGFVSPEETYAWWSGASPKARPVSAFPATLALIVEDCGSRRVNLGFSGGQSRLTDFKEQLGAVPLSVPVIELTPRPRTPWHALLVFGREKMRARAARPGVEGARA
jgi:hypothetical protein